MYDPHASHPRVSDEDLEGDLISADDPRYGLIWINPHRMGGEPCFYGTRVPVRSMWDYLEVGHTLDYFLDQFPGVDREQAIGVMELASRHALAGVGKR